MPIEPTGGNSEKPFISDQVNLRRGFEPSLVSDDGADYGKGDINVKIESLFLAALKAVNGGFAPAGKGDYQKAPIRQRPFEPFFAFLEFEEKPE